MLYQYIRLFDSDNGVLTDESLVNQQDSSTTPWDLVKDEDFKYLAKFYPFNNFFLEVETANDVTCTMKIEYWDNLAWREAVDVLDGTSSGGVSMAQSGVVQFSLNNDYGWHNIADTTANSAPTVLNSITVYDQHWIRISFTDTLKNTTAVSRLSYAFTTSQQLDNLDIDINNYLGAFGSGKTNWASEIMTASNLVVRDLKSKGLVLDEGQILLLQDVSIPTDYKTLELLMANMGPSFVAKRDYYSKMYSKTINITGYTFDTNLNGKIDKGELTGTTTLMVR